MSVAGDLGMRAIMAMLPPHDGESMKLFWWRIKLCCVSVGSLLLLLAFAGMALGFIPFLSSGFETRAEANDLATKDSVVKLTSTVDYIRDTQKVMLQTIMDNNILELRSRYCTAKDGLKAELYVQLQNKIVEYQHQNNGQAYPLTPCPE